MNTRLVKHTRMVCSCGMVLLDVFGLDADTLADALETMQANCERHSTLYPVNLHSVTTTTSWDVQEAGAEDDAL